MSAPETPTWTGRLRGAAVRTLPPEQLLPDAQPVYVSSWIYVFGVLTIAAFAVVTASGSSCRCSDRDGGTRRRSGCS